MSQANGESMRIESVAAPVRQQVAQTLRNAIMLGRFLPGQRLVEKDLCELMNVSRPSVREALRELESEGLVENIPNKGPRVASISTEDITNIYQIRGVLEALGAKLFALNATDAQIATLEKAVENVATAYRGKSSEENLSAKGRFYDLLLEGAGNSLLTSTHRSITARVNVLRRLSLSSQSRLPESLKEIRIIMKAIKRRDATAAFDASIAHIEFAATAALQSLPKEPVEAQSDSRSSDKPASRSEKRKSSV